MIRTLMEYEDLPILFDNVRVKYHDEILNTIMNDKDKYHLDIQEIIDYFMADLQNADFIRLVEKIKQERI